MFLDEFIDDFYRKLGTDCGLGSQHVIGLKGVNRQSGDLLAEAQQQAVGKEGVLKALDTAAVSLRSKLGESLSTVKEYATPLAEATTSSLEALKMREFPRLNSSPRPEAFYVDDISRRLRGIG